MNSRLKSFPLILVGVLFFLVLTVIILNTIRFGRADQVLLEPLASLAKEMISCSAPERAKIFTDQYTKHPSLESLIFVLVEDKSSVIATSQKQKTQDLEGFYGASRFFSNIYSFELSCPRNLELILIDKRRGFFKQLFLSRFSNMLLMTSIPMLFISIGLWFYFQRRGVRASEVLLAFSEMNTLKRLSTNRFDPARQWVFKFNLMANRLAESMEASRRAEEEKTNFLNKLAHDIRTPLASLMAGLDTLCEFEDRLDTNDRLKLQARLRLDVDYFRSLLDDLFFIATMNELKPNVTWVSLTALCRDVMFRYQSEDSHRKIYFDSREDEHRIYGVRSFLERMLDNLISNAFRHGVGDILLEVSSRESEFIVRVSNQVRSISELSLNSWGKASSLKLGQIHSRKLHDSLGIGSSIICFVANHHNGYAEISLDDSKNVCVEVVLKDIVIKK